MIGQIIGAIGSMATAGINNAWASERAERDRAENYRYGEMTADNADARTRALYRDFYSPQALMQQYKEAGLSPSLMFGGTPGQGGTSGAQGTGASGISTPYMPVSMLEAAQIAKTMAETKNIKANTANTEKDTELKELQRQYNTIANQLFGADATLLGLYLTDENGQSVGSITDLANNSDTWDIFKENLMKYVSEDKKALINTEKGQQFLRQIYTASKQVGRDIAVFKHEEVNARFMQQVLQALKDHNFAEMNAEQIVSTLKTTIDINDLTQQQKEAWQRLLKGMEKIGGEGFKNANLVMMMLMQQFMGTALQAVGTGARLATL